MSDQPSTSQMDSGSRHGFCVFINTVCEGHTPSIISDGKPCVFDTEFEAQSEIVDCMMIRMQEFLDGEREFGDAISTEEYVVQVTLLPDGSIIDQDGRRFGQEV